jgi:hypothetical protein
MQFCDFIRCARVYRFRGCGLTYGNANNKILLMYYRLKLLHPSQIKTRENESYTRVYICKHDLRMNCKDIT